MLVVQTEAIVFSLVNKITFFSAALIVDSRSMEALVIHLEQWFLKFINPPNTYVILKACFEAQFVVQ